MGGSLRTWFRTRNLAHEVVFLHASETSMGICRTNHAEFVGVYSQFAFEFQTIAQCGTRVLELEHLGLLQFGHVEVGFVPALVIRKFIVRRKERMGLAVPLDLRCFIDSFAESTGFSVLTVDWFAGEGLDQGEHPAV